MVKTKPSTVVRSGNMIITDEFMRAREFLFQNVPSVDDPYDQPAIVCVQHKRFVPCRSCMYRHAAEIPYSIKHRDVQTVKQYQQGS